MKPHEIFWLVCSILTLIITAGVTAGVVVAMKLALILIVILIVAYWIISILVINDVDDIFWLKFLTYTNPILSIFIGIMFFNIWFDSLFKKKENE